MSCQVACVGGEGLESQIESLVMHDAFRQSFFFNLVISYGQLDILRVDRFRLGLLLLGLRRRHEPAAGFDTISGGDVADSLYTKRITSD